MIFLRLDLRAFGSFSNVSLDFSARPQSLHVVYGPNEAGKSTTLRAVRSLLYGIDQKTTDGYLHKLPDLRVGGRLSDGTEELELIRRKGQKNTLLGADGTTVVDEVVLRRFLGGVGKEQFDTMFGLDHQTLRDGGEALLRAGGELGESLFDAALGGAVLHEVLGALKAEAEELFTPQAHNRHLNKALKEFDEAKKAVRDAQLAPESYVKQEKHLSELSEQKNELKRRIPTVEVELHRLRRAQKTHHHVLARRRAVDERARLGVVVPVGIGVAKEREKAERRLEDARRREAQLSAQLSGQELTRSALPETEPLLASSDELETLRDRLANHKKAEADLARRRGQAAEKRVQIEALHAKLGDIRPAQRLDEATQTRLAVLSGRHGSVRDAVQRAVADQRGVAERRRLCAEELASLPPACDPSALEAALDAVEARADLSGRVTDLARQIADLEERAAQRLAALGLSLSLAAASRLAAPSEKEARAAVDETDRLRQEERKLQENLEEVASQRADSQSKLAALQMEGAVPSEEDLTLARASRDGLIEAALAGPRRDGARASDDVIDVVAVVGAVRAADLIADRLRREAHAVAERAQLVTEERRLADKASRLDERLGQVRVAAERHAASILARWSVVPLPSGSRTAAELLVTAERLAALPALAEELAERRRLHRSLVEERSTLGTALEAALLPRASRSEGRTESKASQRSTGASGSLALALVPDLVTLRTRAREAVRTEAQRQRLTQTLADFDRALALGVTELGLAEEALKAWQSAWAVEVARLGLPASSTVEEANAVLGVLRDLWSREDDANDIAQRMRSMQHDAELFAADVAERCRTLAPDLVGLDVVSATTTLVSRLTEARRTAGQRQQLGQAIAELGRELTIARADAEIAVDQLASLCAAAGAPDVAALLELESRAGLAQRLDGEIAELDRRIEETSDGMTLPELDLLFTERSVDELAQRCDELAAELGAAQEQRGELDAELGRTAEGLKYLATQSSAVDKAAEAQSLFARARGHAERWLRLRLASGLLSRQLERHRERNQGPVLTRAGQLFARLTAGHYRALETGFDDHDRPVLTCVRTDGRKVPVDGLSDGARDQLYLSLRLASLEQQARPLPLVVDDIFVHFDDERARRGLELLAEHAARSQVLLFTHHARLVELAESLPADQRAVHRL